MCLSSIWIGFSEDWKVHVRGFGCEGGMVDLPVVEFLAEFPEHEAKVSRMLVELINIPKIRTRIGD